MRPLPTKAEPKAEHTRSNPGLPLLSTTVRKCSSLLASFLVGFSFFASGPGQQQPLHLSFSGRRYLSGLIRA
jgi:hypothetical protein